MILYELRELGGRFQRAQDTDCRKTVVVSSIIRPGLLPFDVRFSTVDEFCVQADRLKHSQSFDSRLSQCRRVVSVGSYAIMAANLRE